MTAPVTQAPVEPLPIPTPRRRWWGRILAAAFGLFVASIGGATWYGHWLSTDRLLWTGTADCVVTLSGYHQNERATHWFQQGQVREIWVLRTRDSRLIEMGIQESFATVSLRQLKALGVPEAQVRVLSVDARETQVPRLLESIARAGKPLGSQQIVIESNTLEVRYLRQIADAALPQEQSNRLRFVALPNDEYPPMRWWLCRSGWKDVHGISMQILSNVTFGPLSGFDDAAWNPDEWEARTFPQLRPSSP